MGTDKGNGDNSANMAQRLRQLEALTGGLVRSAAEPDAIPENETPVSLVPVPRRSRIFLRHGKGHGEFADLTLTAPIVRSYLT